MVDGVVIPHVVHQQALPILEILLSRVVVFEEVRTRTSAEILQNPLLVSQFGPTLEGRRSLNDDFFEEKPHSLWQLFFGLPDLPSQLGPKLFRWGLFITECENMVGAYVSHFEGSPSEFPYSSLSRLLDGDPGWVFNVYGVEDEKVISRRHGLLNLKKVFVVLGRILREDIILTEWLLLQVGNFVRVKEQFFRLDAVPLIAEYPWPVGSKLMDESFSFGGSAAIGTLGGVVVEVDMRQCKDVSDLHELAPVVLHFGEVWGVVFEDRPGVYVANIIQ